MTELQVKLKALETRERQIQQGVFDPKQVLGENFPSRNEDMFPQLKDPGLCEAEGCAKPTKEQCSRCKMRVYCCRACQTKAWKEYHKEECSKLQLCKRASQVAFTFAIVQDGATSMGVITTQEHGSHFYVMEQYEVFGAEQNRKVILASTTDLSHTGILACVMDSILFPEFDSDQAGRRRPYYAEIFKETFPDPTIVDAICVVLLRLGVKIKSLGDDVNASPKDHEWNRSWFLVQKGWHSEISDPIFLRQVDKSRRKPLVANGMARKAVAARVASLKSVPRLNPADYPKRKQALKQPFSRPEEFMNVVCKDGDVVLMWLLDEGVPPQILLRQKVQLQTRTGRPYADDVLLLIYKAVVLAKKRPDLILLGQPSVCVLADVRAYEKALDYTLCKGSFSLASKHYLEGFWDSLVQRGFA